MDEIGVIVEIRAARGVASSLAGIGRSEASAQTATEEAIRRPILDGILGGASRARRAAACIARPCSARVGTECGESDWKQRKPACGVPFAKDQSRTITTI